MEELQYDSDGNEPPVSTIEDSFYVEPEAGLEIRRDKSEIYDDCQVVLFDIKEIKSMKVDQLRKELRSRGLSDRGLKAELIERLNNACEDKVPLINEVTTSVGPSGFDENAKWKLLKPDEEADEPESLDPLLVEPSRARDQRTRAGIADGERGIRKFSYCEKFSREKYSVTALQLVIDKSEDTTTKKRKKY